MKKSVYSGLALSLLLIALRCSQNPADGNGSHTGNPALIGVVYYSDGSRAANVAVKFFQVNHDPMADSNALVVYSAHTNDTGAYKIDSVPADTFNLLASAGASLGYKDSVKVKPDTITLAPPCTLKTQGSIKGVVRLQPGDDARTVFILFMGTNTWYKPGDSIGNFTAENLAEGKYSVKILTTLPDYKPMDTSFTVKSGVNSTLLDTLKLVYTGIPVPTGLKITYDTMKQIVTLTWNQVDTVLVKGYNVYRRALDSSFGQIPLNETTLVMDTVYKDSTAIQDQSYEYKIVALDKGDNAGKLSTGDSVRIESAFTLQTTVGNGSGTGDGYITYLRAVALGNSGDVYVADAGNHRIQRFSSAGVYATKWGTSGSGKGQFGDIADIAMDSSGNIFVVESDNNRVQKLTNNGDTLLQWGSQGTGDGAFQSPVRITVYKDKVYIGEWNGQRVQQFDLNGSFISKFDVGQPVSAVCANDSLLFVMINDRTILKYAVSGQFIDTIFTSRQQVNNCTLHSDLLYISNLSANKIQGIDLMGSLIFQFKLPPMQDGTPQDIAVQSERALFIARYAGYVQEFTRK